MARAGEHVRSSSKIPGRTERSLYMLRFSRWWPPLAWAIVISIFSTGLFTAANTGSVIIPILHWLLPRASPATIATLHHFIRKCGHITEYFILSLLILRAVRGGRRGVHLAWALIAIALVAGYASLDEFHQSLVPGRTPAVADVMLDTASGIAAQILAALVVLLGEARQQRLKGATQSFEASEPKSR